MPEVTVIRRSKKNKDTVVPGIGDLDEKMDELPDNPFEAEDPEFDTETNFEADLEDDEEEDENEDEEDSDDSEVTLAEDDNEEAPTRRPPPRSPSRRPPSRSSRERTRPEKSPFSDEIAEELSNTLASLNYEPGKHKITVYREAPQFDPETGKSIIGLCKTYNRVVTPEDVQREFGGGIYKLIVMGPRKATGRGNEMKAKFELKIAGDPIVPLSEQQKRRQAEKEERKQEDFVNSLLERQERREEAHKKELQAMNKTVFEVLEKTMNRPAPDPQAAATAVMTPILTMMEKESARREREAEERRRMEEDRRRDDERRWKEERDDARRRHETEMKRQEQQAQLQLKQMEMQQENMKRQMEIEAQNNREQLKVMLGFMQKTDSEKESRAKETTTFQMEFMKQMNDMQKSSMELQLKLLSDQLKDLKGKDGFTETLEKWKVINSIVNPGEPEKDTWEKIVDRAGEILPGMVTGLSALRARSVQGVPQGYPQPPLIQQGPPQPGRMAPGSVAVVENVSHMLPPAAQQEEEVETLEVENDLTDFAGYPPEGSNEEVLLLLVKNLDLAVQRGLGEEEIFEKCLSTLPDGQKQFLKMFPIDTMVQFVEAQVPESWALRSIDGDLKLRAVHEKLVTAS